MITLMASPTHLPVLLHEVVEGLRVKPGGRYIDCTVNGGGHARAILQASSPGGRLLGLDLDAEAIKGARARLESFGDAAILVEENYRNLARVCAKYGFTGVDGVLFDLGLSSLQLDDPLRGFSFQADSGLDMRYSLSQKVTAGDLVNGLSEVELANLLYEYGEETRSRKIARTIVSRRPIGTTRELAEAVEKAVGGRKSRIHPATRTFMALRIAVNDELGNLREGLLKAIQVLRTGGRLAVISYHSLEDRIVKETFRREGANCICPPSLPVCTCGHQAAVTIVTGKVMKPSLLETVANPRSRSARMRIVERV